MTPQQPIAAAPLTDVDLWGTETGPETLGDNWPVVPPGADLTAAVCPITQINCSAWYPREGCRLGVCDQARRALQNLQQRSV